MPQFQIKSQENDAKAEVKGTLRTTTQTKKQLNADFKEVTKTKETKAVKSQVNAAEDKVKEKKVLKKGYMKQLNEVLETVTDSTEEDQLRK